jgi:hypothetical protein
MPGAGHHAAYLCSRHKDIERGTVTIRKLYQAVLCFMLCPLLAAQETIGDAHQQNSQPSAATAAVTRLVQPLLIATSHGEKIELAVLDPLSASNTIVGQTVRLSVARDAVNNEGIAIRAGTVVNGIVTRVRYGSYKSNRGDQLDVRLTDLTPGTLVRLRLANISPREPTYGDDPAQSYRGSATMMGPGSRGLWLATIVVFSVLFVALGARKH